MTGVKFAGTCGFLQGRAPRQVEGITYGQKASGIWVLLGFSFGGLTGGVWDWVSGFCGLAVG